MVKIGHDHLVVLTLYQPIISQLWLRGVRGEQGPLLLSLAKLSPLVTYCITSSDFVQRAPPVQGTANHGSAHAAQCHRQTQFHHRRKRPTCIASCHPEPHRTIIARGSTWPHMSCTPSDCCGLARPGWAIARPGQRRAEAHKGNPPSETAMSGSCCLVGPGSR